MSFTCNICNKNYKSRSGLWKHLSKHKDTEENTDVTKSDHMETHLLPSNGNIGNIITDGHTKYLCFKCNKALSNRHSKSRHEKNCSAISPLNILEKFKQLEYEITEIKNKPNVVNNYTSNTLNKVEYIITAPGKESIQHLSFDDQQNIMLKGLNSLTYLVELINFNKNFPINHSYCVTALNDKHASMIDDKTNSIIKTDKTTLFDKVLVNNLKNLETIATNPNFSYGKRSEYKDKINQLKEILFKNKNGLKRYYSEINLISYNNKDLILETWVSLKSLDKIIESESETPKLLGFEDLANQHKSDDSSSESSDDEIKIKQNKLKKIIESNTLHSSDSDTDDIEPSEIIIKGINYILEGNKIYFKNSIGFKDKLYGKYSNGKVIKIKQKEFDI
jgi:hypothetical protein